MNLPESDKENQTSQSSVSFKKTGVIALSDVNAPIAPP